MPPNKYVRTENDGAVQNSPPCQMHHCFCSHPDFRSWMALVDQMACGSLLIQAHAQFSKFLNDDMPAIFTRFSPQNIWQKSLTTGDEVSFHHLVPAASGFSRITWNLYCHLLPGSFLKEALLNRPLFSICKM